jgi:hypothetical protein
MRSTNGVEVRPLHQLQILPNAIDGDRTAHQRVGGVQAGPEESHGLAVDREGNKRCSKKLTSMTVPT